MPQPLPHLRLPNLRLAALALCIALLALLTLSTAGAHAQRERGTSPTTPAATSPRGENTPLGPATRAAGGEDADTADAADDGNSGGIVRTIVGLLIVIAVIYGVTWVLKQLKTREDDADGFGLESRATLPLGPGRSVHLVRAGNEYLLLGASDGGVHHLRTYTEQEARAAGFPISEADDLPVLRDRSTAAQSSILGRIRDLTVRK